MSGIVSVPQLECSTYEEYSAVESLGELLVQSVDETLTDLLGKRTKEAVYDCLERNYALGREDIPDNLSKFFQLMEETFGSGSRTIAKSIIKRMFSKLDWEFVEMPGYQFTDYLDAIRKRITRTLLDQVNPTPRNQ